MKKRTSRRSTWQATCLSYTSRGHGWKRSEEHTSELQSQSNLVCRLLLEKKKIKSTVWSTSLTVMWFRHPDTRFSHRASPFIQLTVRSFSELITTAFRLSAKTCRRTL